MNVVSIVGCSPFGKVDKRPLFQLQDSQWCKSAHGQRHARLQRQDQLLQSVAMSTKQPLACSLFQGGVSRSTYITRYVNA